MTQLTLDQLQHLLYLFVGLIFITLTGLILYIVSASRKRKGTWRADAPIPPPSARQPAGEQVLALLRDSESRRLQVEIDGTRYQRLSDVTDPQVKRRIVSLAMELIQFTGVLDSGAVQPASMEKTRTWREDLREESQAELERAHAASSGPATTSRTPDRQEIEAQFLSMLTDMGKTSSSPSAPGLVDSLQRRLQPKMPDSARPRTFVDDIDDIVQRRVQFIPAMSGRDLHVRPGAGGKVHFSFEGKEYDSLDDVPNLTARQVVKDAIQEWDEMT